MPHLVALGLYGGLAVLYTWPVARGIRGLLPGFPGDNLGALHTLWWVFEEVSSGRVPWSVDLYAYPASTVVFHPSPLMEALSLPLTAAAGPVVSANALLLGSFIATGYTAFLLVRRLTGSAPLGLAGGALFTGTGPHQFDLLFNTNAVWALPLVWLALLEQRRRPGRWPLVALAASALALSNFYFAAYFLPLSFLAFVPWRRLRDRRRLAGLVAAAATTLLVCIVAYVPSLAAADADTREQLSSVAAQEDSRPPTELLALVIGSPGHPVLGDAFSRLGEGLEPDQAPNAGSAYAGLVVLVLAAIGWPAARRTGPWTLLAAAGLVLMLGPQLKVGGRELAPLPYALIEHVPLLGYLRAPGRFYALMALALIVMAAFGMARLAGRAGRAGPAVVAALAGLALFDSLYRFPQPMTPTAVPPVYERLAGLPGRPALIEAPGGGFNDYEWLAHQRRSGLPIVNDAAPRPTPRDIPLYRNPFLAGTVAGPAPFFLEDDAETHRRTGRPDPARAEGVRRLAAEGVGYAVLHKRTTFGWADPSDPGFALYRGFLERHLGAPAHEDADVLLYALPGAPGLEEVRGWAGAGPP